MTDYLIEQYNTKMAAIQDRESKDLAGALEIYSNATKTILERHSMERLEASTELAASMSQRDHEYINGKPTLPAPVAIPEPPPARLPTASRLSLLRANEPDDLKHTEINSEERVAS